MVSVGTYIEGEIEAQRGGGGGGVRVLTRRHQGDPAAEIGTESEHGATAAQEGGIGTDGMRRKEAQKKEEEKEEKEEKQKREAGRRAS